MKLELTIGNDIFTNDKKKFRTHEYILYKIQTAVYDEKAEQENRSSTNIEFVEKAAVINVKRTVKAIMEHSPILKEMIEKEKLELLLALIILTAEKSLFLKINKKRHVKSNPA